MFVNGAQLGWFGLGGLHSAMKLVTPNYAAQVEFLKLLSIPKGLSTTNPPQILVGDIFQIFLILDDCKDWALQMGNGYAKKLHIPIVNGPTIPKGRTWREGLLWIWDKDSHLTAMVRFGTEDSREV